jgi:hypothetical protein
VLPRSGGVELAAEPVERLRDLLRGVARRTLEEQMLEEVRGAGALLLLVPRACSDPVAERDRANARDPFGDDTLAGVELRYLVLLHRQHRSEAGFGFRVRALRQQEQ